ncbi:MAG: anaerobic ribonucleoside-triphosphate reductase [Candidatus Kariarchaeaceae archaeon]
MNFPNRDEELISFVKNFTINQFMAATTINKREDGLLNLYVNSRAAISFIHDFTLGDSSKTKRLRSLTFDTSLEFRQGLLKGYYEGDGNKTKHDRFEISTISRQLAEDIRSVLVTLGKRVTIRRNRTKAEGNDREYLFIVTEASENTDPSRIFFTEEGKTYCKITKIERSKSIAKHLVDIKIEGIDKLFILGNGIITHNCGSELDPKSIRAMCPMSTDTEVVVKSIGKDISISKIGEVFKRINKGTQYEVWTPNGWKQAKVTKQVKQKLYEVKLSNGFKVRLGEFHLQPVKDMESVMIKDLLDYEDKDYWIPFSKNTWDNDLGSKELGYVVGAFLGDGSYNSNDNLIYSFNVDRQDPINNVTDFFSKLGYKCVQDRMEKNPKLVNLRINGKLRDFMGRYVGGSDALTKNIKHQAFCESIEFRSGLIEGYRDSDGAKDRKRLYSSSERLIKDLSYIRASLGQKWLQNYVDTRDNRLGDNPNYRLDIPDRPNYGELYKEDEHFHYFKIVLITEETNYNGDFYCFEVNSEDMLFTLPSGMVTHNCRLNINLNEIMKRPGSMWGPGDNTGSIGVVTINLNRLAYNARNKNKNDLEAAKKEFQSSLRLFMGYAKDSLEIKRKVITQNLENGLMPYTKEYLGSFDNYFSTIGINGAHEACVNLLGEGLQSVAGKELIIETLEFMNSVLQEYQVESGYLFNLEATPAESAAYRFAQKDQELCPGVYLSGTEETPYLTNSSHLPVDITEDVWFALEHQNDIQPLYSGGTMFHTFLGEKVNDPQMCKKLVYNIATKTRLPYFSITPTFSICKKCGYLSGEHSSCPDCGSECEIFSRIVGYFRPVSNWNEGKKQEFVERTTYFQPQASSLLEITTQTQEEESGSNGTSTVSHTLANTKGINSYVILTTPTCPNCPQAKELLKNHPLTKDLQGSEKNAMIPDEATKSLIKQFNLQSVPTVVFFDESDEAIGSYSGIQSIQQYLE